MFFLPKERKGKSVTVEEGASFLYFPSLPSSCHCKSSLLIDGNSSPPSSLPSPHLRFLRRGDERRVTGPWCARPPPGSCSGARWSCRGDRASVWGWGAESDPKANCRLGAASPAAPPAPSSRKLRPNLLLPELLGRRRGRVFGGSGWSSQPSPEPGVVLPRVSMQTFPYIHTSFG